MNLREKLREILPDLLPKREQDAIKGKELISRVRRILGDAYSDGSLRTQFSLLALEEDTCLARIPNGQGYYLRRAGDPPPSLHDVFLGHTETADVAETLQHRAIALAVRFYDAAGLSVFAYPVEAENWGHPDLVAVQWPAGQWRKDGAYTMRKQAERRAVFRAICVCVPSSVEDCRQAVYRTLACGQWAQEAELLLIGAADEAEVELSRVAAQFGVGIRSLASAEILAELPQADALFQAEEAETRELLSSLPHSLLALPRHTPAPPQPPEETPDVQPVLEWAQQCIARGRVEAYERRVAIS